MSVAMESFFAGMLVMASLVIFLAFLRFWRLSKDRFFIWFAAAFLTFGLGWTIRTFDPGVDEHAHLVYLPRLAGFLMILLAIYDKNRRARE